MLRFPAVGLILGIVFSYVQAANGQLGNGNNNNLPGTSGILINADGVIDLHNVSPLSPGAFKKQLERYAAENLPPELIVATPERVLSLKNLASAIQERVQQQQPLSPEMLYLAGLQRIDSVAFDVEGKDIYLIGPADAFAPDNTGRMIGRGSGRPVLRLDDLVTVLRAGAEDGRRGIGCSIDPTNENMARLQEFLRLNSTPATPAQVQMRFRQMANVLGPQNISVWGVPAHSHFAAALVEADLRMKRIAMGLESSGVPAIRSHLSLLRPQGNSLQRWWFVPMYEPLEINADRTVFLLKGQRAKLLAQEEFTDAAGNRSDAAMTRQSTEKFAQLFTDNFQTLANKSPAFGELQNLYDIAVAATLIKREAPRHQLNEVLSVYLNEDRLTPVAYAVPKMVPSASTFRSTGPGMLIGLVGGVTIDMNPVLDSTRAGEIQPVNGLRQRVGGNRIFGDAKTQ